MADYRATRGAFWRKMSLVYKLYLVRFLQQFLGVRARQDKRS